MKIKHQINLQLFLRTRGKDAFTKTLPTRARLFDIGCGNNSPERTKTLRPDIYYVGLDIQDYKQSQNSTSMADEYIIVESYAFLNAIADKEGTMDAVISSHNLEHCDDTYAVISSMAKSLKCGGRMYLAFPCEASIKFPSRRGTLRFSDDLTHKVAPHWQQVIDQLQNLGMSIEFKAERYRPLIASFLGALLEPFSAITQRIMPVGSTWALYGFESIIWAKRMTPMNPEKL